VVITLKIHAHNVDACAGVFVSRIKTKAPEQNDLKLGTVVVLDSLLKSIDFLFKRSRVMGTGSISSRIFRLLPNQLPSESAWIYISIEYTFYLFFAVNFEMVLS